MKPLWTELLGDVQELDGEEAHMDSKGWDAKQYVDVEYLSESEFKRRHQEEKRLREAKAAKKDAKAARKTERAVDEAVKPQMAEGKEMDVIKVTSQSLRDSATDLNHLANKLDCSMFSREMTLDIEDLRIEELFKWREDLVEAISIVTPGHIKDQKYNIPSKFNVSGIILQAIEKAHSEMEKDVMATDWPWGKYHKGTYIQQLKDSLRKALFQKQANKLDVACVLAIITETVSSTDKMIEKAVVARKQVKNELNVLRNQHLRDNGEVAPRLQTGIRKLEREKEGEQGSFCSRKETVEIACMDKEVKESKQADEDKPILDAIRNWIYALPNHPFARIEREG